MNVVYIFDENYAAIAGVSICSLLENNKDVNSINIFIIDGGISEGNKIKLTQMIESYDRRISFLTAEHPEVVFSTYINIQTWSYSSFYRLYLERILPLSIEKVLYIDSDTLVTGELNDLYNIDINDAMMAAAYDCAPNPKYDLGLEVSDKYFNSGVLLFNLKRIREEEVFDRFRECLIEFKGTVPYIDQGVINYVLRNEIRLIPAKYNIMTLSLIYNKFPTFYFSKTDPYYTKDEMIDAIKNPCIVHLTGHSLCIRPWYYDSNHFYNDLWKEYLYRTPWRDDFHFKKMSLNNYEKEIKIINKKIGC